MPTTNVHSRGTGPDANDDYGTWWLLPGGRDNPTGEPYLWGYGFNMGITWSDGTGLFDDGTHVQAPNGGQVYPIVFMGVTINVEVRRFAGILRAAAKAVSPRAARASASSRSCRPVSCGGRGESMPLRISAAAPMSVAARQASRSIPARRAKLSRDWAINR